MVIKDQSLKSMGSDNGQENLVRHDNEHSVVSTEYVPWIHVQFKNRRGRRNIAVNNYEQDIGRKTERRISVGQKDVRLEEVQEKVQDECNGNKADEVSRKVAVTGMFEQSMNQFAVLVEENEEGILVKAVSNDKVVDKGSELMEPKVNFDMNYGSEDVKVKLAKELKSLGPVNSEKKKRNGRGARKKADSLYLKEMVRYENDFFIGLMETKLSSIGRMEVDCLLGNEWDYFHQPVVGTSGGILVLWNINLVSFEVCEASSQVIIGNLSIPSLGMWKIATVYGNRCNKERSDLWNQLERSMENSNPSIIGGDFNCILNKDEKRGGKRFLFSKGPREMKSFMLNSDFHDIGFVGPSYTWCNNKEGNSRIWERNKCKDLNALKDKLKKEIHELQNEEALSSNWSADDLVELRNKPEGMGIVFSKSKMKKIRCKWMRIKLRNFTKFFEKKWEYRECEITGWPYIMENQKLNAEDMELLNAEFTKNELQIAVFQQGNNKLHGADGITSSFYKSYWNIIWETLWNAVRNFFNSRHLNKVLSLVIRLKKGMARMIFEEQAAFIHGRSIAENYLLAQEIFHKFKISKNKKGMMAVKLDMEQAYDSMGWTTLRHILRWYGFPIAFSNLLLECVVDVRFSIIINRKNSEWINSQSGFRQGCLLSPYLFIMCFQLITNSLEQRGKCLGIHVSSGGPKITHLLYADDALIFSHASVELDKSMKTIVEKFCKYNG
ncbi:uncharacterized protein LOC114581094 [Dendrobium catenatum]|uniref:uncharacterized protein LOC114581094 n=1 Tax=Dendrobium catenatum TaxID=906689 RepID=UPI00109F9739|nr:uncharacterized protein LOC114581094 [Dendrobium catenatum]